MDKNWGFDVANIDRSARPQDDFFQFANGRWLNKNPIPPEESRWGSFYVLRKKSREALREILESSKRQKTGHGSNLQKVRDYYLSAMDMKRRDKYGAKPLDKFFSMANGIKTADDIILLSARFRKMGIASLWHPDTDQDLKNKNIVRLYIAQGGLSMPDRDYYLKHDKKSKKLREKYRRHIKKMHQLVFGKNDKKFIDSVINIETRLARASMTRVELRDLEKQYNKMPIQKLKRISPAIEWDGYFHEIKAPKNKPAIICQPLFIKKADKMLKDVPIEAWKDYFKWKIMDEFAPYLSEKMEKESFNFYGKILSGAKKMRSLWERAAIEIDGTIGEALGELYVKKYFPESAKKHINELVDNLIASYRQRIKSLDWMSEATKKKALEKLNAFSRKLGYPDKWKNYKKLDISRDSYLQNHINAYAFEFAREMKKIGKRPDKKEWHMTPPTVNAYNNFLLNEVVFPAGIMQPPFFGNGADDAVNYGAIGSVIGHEFIHGFDDKGSTFDKNGEMKNWWKKEDRKRFEKKAGKLIKQYDKFQVLPGIFVNGKLTIGENIADLGGLVIAYYAYKEAMKGNKRKIIEEFTPEQRFFLGAAQAEQGHTREAEIRRLTNIDPHSPSKARVNIPFSNMVEFYDAFGVKKGDGMWLPEKDRVVIW